MVELATFGSEFVALRVCKELIVALRYKLQMFGVPVDRPASVFCDNQECEHPRISFFAEETQCN